MVTKYNESSERSKWHSRSPWIFPVFTRSTCWIDYNLPIWQTSIFAKLALSTPNTALGGKKETCETVIISVGISTFPFLGLFFDGKQDWKHSEASRQSVRKKEEKTNKVFTEKWFKWRQKWCLATKYVCVHEQDWNHSEVSRKKISPTWQRITY